jgi:hypothetical protein
MKIKAYIQKLQALWASLPHSVQAALLAFAAAAGTTFVHAISEGGCFAAVCLKHYAATSIGAGLVAARAFYMVPNRPVSSVPPPPKT